MLFSLLLVKEPRRYATMAFSRKSNGRARFETREIEKNRSPGRGDSLLAHARDGDFGFGEIQDFAELFIRFVHDLLELAARRVVRAVFRLSCIHVEYERDHRSAGGDR